MPESMFETPNTRLRRRKDDGVGSGGSGSGSGSGSVTRPSGSQEDDRVVWVHDQRLRRAVLSATEHGKLISKQPQFTQDEG